MAQFTSSNKPQECLYVLLGLEQNCNQDEIKKAYRLMARKHHPDKNGNTDEATAKFQAINNANTVLSDPQERAWYDDHREDILYGASAGEQGNDDINFDTSSYISPFAYDTFKTNAERSFWNVYNTAFDEINRQEQIAFSRRRDDGTKKEEFAPRPTFGGPTTSVSDTKRFYNTWFAFTTKKTYSWVDEYDTREANGRRMRRAMDKENSKARSSAKKKFVDSVHSLIRFVSRRDPRVKAYHEKDRLEKERKEKQRERIQIKKKEDRQAAMAQWKRERTLELEQQERDDEQARREGRVVDRGFSFADEERTKKESKDGKGKGNGTTNSDGTSDNGNNNDDNDGSAECIMEEFECPACNKRFKSSQQWENHQKSKKHKKNVELLKRELMAEDAELDGDALDAAMGVEKKLSKKERRKLKQKMKADMMAEAAKETFAEENDDNSGSDDNDGEEIVVVASKKLSKKEKRRKKEMEKRQAELDAKTIKKKKKKKKKSKDTEEDVVAAAEIQSDQEQEEGESKEAAPTKKLTKKQIRRIKLKKEREEKAIEDEKKRLEEEEAERIAAALAAEAANEEDEGEQKGVDQVDFQPEYQKQEKKKKKKKPRQGKSNFTKKPNPVGF